jgi:protein O-mannosyl-transferase
MSPEASPPKSTSTWRGLLLIVATLTLAFWTSTSGEFINDDVTLIARNPVLQESGNLGELLTRPMWSGLPEFEGDVQVGHWRPITSLALKLGYSLGGSERAPFAFHLISLLFHICAALAAWALARRVLRHEGAALFAALLFALHPLQTESVAWISALNDPLAAALVFASLERWLAWRERDGGLPIAAAGFYLLALLTKEPAIALLPLVLVLEFVGLGKPALRWRGFGVLLAVTLLWFALRVWVFGEVSGGFLRSNADYGGMTWRLRQELIGSAVWRTLWPFDLAPGEPFRESWLTGSGDARAKAIGFGVAVLLGLVALKRGLGATRSLFALATLGFLAALLPPLIAPGSLGQTPFAARYVYVPVFFAALGLAGWFLSTSSASVRRALAIGGGLLLGLSAWRVQTDQATWDDPIAYYERVTERYPDAPNGFWNLGESLRSAYIATTSDQGVGEVNLLNRAFAAYETSAELLTRAATDTTIPKDEIDYLRTGLGQAWCYLLQAEVDEYRDFGTPQTILEMLQERVMQREAANRAAGSPRPPLPVEQVFNLLGIVKLRAGEANEAAEDFRRALELSPNFVPAIRNLALIRLDQGQHALATQLFRRALSLVPDDPDVVEPYARSLFEEGWTEEALNQAARLEQLDPAHPTPEVLRGLDAMKRRDFRTALTHFDRALAKAPRNADALYHRGMTLEQLGNRDDAIIALRRAAESNGAHFPAHYNLARLLLDSKALDAAKPYLERAYVIGRGRPELPAMRTILIQLDPENAPRMREFAEVDDRRKDAAGALFWTERALNADPDNGRSRHLMGRLLMDQDEYVLALPELVRAAELLPKGYIVFQDLGRCNAQLGRYPSARTAYERAIELLRDQTYPGDPNDPPQVIEAFEATKQGEISKLEMRLSELPK